MSARVDFDVVICGGGLAGLTLARQLRLELPEVTIALIDRLRRPLPEAAFKVGESSIELGTHYLGEVLQLKEYFRERHLRKLGLRFFMGKSQGAIDHRPETGTALFPPVPSYQIDRGRLENDLRGIVEEMGVAMFEGVTVEDIVLAQGEARHAIHCRHKDDQSPFSLTARWVVDALGRRRLLQTKLGLKREHEHHASAAWWRYDERVNVNDLASEQGGPWRSSSVEDRYFSTNHLMDRGYWVWLIPLGSGATSVGIVADETIHPLHSYGTSYQAALEWLQVHEPRLWAFIREKPPMDFHSLRNYSYASAQVFSRDRWSCVGEAGFFLDPLYSVGSDFIATGNTITVEMIRRDRQGRLTGKQVEAFNRLVLQILFPICLAFYRGTYRAFGHAQIFTPKLAWDTALHWAFLYQVVAQGLVRDPTEEVFSLGQRYLELNERVQQLFSDWSQHAPPRAMYVRGDMTRMRLLQLLHFELVTRRSPEQVLEASRRNLDRFEELAQALFWQAVKECYPDQPMLATRPWINVWRMTLDPEQWTGQRLFDAPTRHRPVRPMRDNLTGIFAPQSLREVLVYELPYNVLHAHQGFVYYRILPPLLRRFVVNKPALWLRHLLVRDFPSKPTETRQPVLSHP